jgi:hypothetical protein
MKPQCVVLAGTILSSLDTTQDPCENFYEYVSEWNTPFPPAIWAKSPSRTQIMDG